MEGGCEANCLVSTAHMPYVIRTRCRSSLMAMAEYFALVKQIDFDYLYTGMTIYAHALC